MSTAFPFFPGGEKICAQCEYGEHIELRCRKHLDLVWHTKNIGYIGGRSIFFDLDGTCQKANKTKCDCPLSELFHPEHAQSKTK